MFSVDYGNLNYLPIGIFQNTIALQQQFSDKSYFLVMNIGAEG
jgi:hypothetical protein